MSNLEKLKKNLSKYPTVFMTVIDTATEATRKVYQDEINAQGGLEGYLKWLHGQGTQEVYIEPRIKNGSSHRLYGVPFRLKLGTSPQEPTAPEALPVSTATAVPQRMPEPQMPGLMGVGLGQYMEAHSAMRAYQVLQQDHAELKAKYENLFSEKERLRDEVIELKRTNDRLEDKIDRKSPLDSIDINQALPVLIGLLKPQPQSQGLNAPQKALSPIKEGLRTSIEQDAMPDEIVEKLYKVLERYVQNDENFITGFENLFGSPLKKVDNG